MADRGITFSAAMVRALLDGRKTQTRRLVPDQTCWRDDGTVWTGFMGWQDREWAFENRGAVGRGVLPPHAPGDRLYVREHWKVWQSEDAVAPRDMPAGRLPIHYLADLPAPFDPFLGRHRQARHMPRWASRLTLLVTEVRVQRLQDISAEAAILKLREQLDAAFNPVTGERKVLFTVIMAETAKVEHGKHFPTSHISNADNFEDQIAMAKAFVTKCEDFMADEKGGDL